jgi:hypothetical protein
MNHILNEDVVHDPGEWTPYPVSTYPRRDWVVTLVAQPARPEELPRKRDRGIHCLPGGRDK